MHIYMYIYIITIQNLCTHFFCLHKMLVTIAKQPKVFGHFNSIFHSTYIVYCGINIVRGGQMFVAFVGNHCPWTCIPTYLYAIIYLIFIKIIPMVHYQRNYVPTNQENFWLHWPPGIKMIPQYWWNTMSL